MREQPFERFFKVKRDFTDQAGRKHAAGTTAQLNDREEVRILMSLGFVVPGGNRTIDAGSVNVQWVGQ